MSRALAAAFTTEKDLLWSRPFCTGVFHFGGAIGDIYLGEFNHVIGGYSHEGIAKRWGEYKSIITAQDGYFQVGSAQATLINHLLFTSGTKRFSDLWSGLGPLGIEADIYLNFWRGQNDIIQQLVFAAVMRPGRYSPDECDVELKSISEKYLDKQVGYVLNQTDLPSIDPDEIGKTANILYGTISKAVAQWVVAGKTGVLRADIDAAVTTIPITDAVYDAFAASGTIQIGSEKIAYTGHGGSAGSRTFTGGTRGSGGTTAAVHHKDDTILEILSEYTALASGLEIKSIGQVYIEKDGKIIPVTPSSTELANTTLVSGQTFALIKFTTPPLIPVKDLVSLTDDIGVSDTIGISQANTESNYDQAGSDQTLSFSTAISNNSYQDVSISFPAQEKTKSSGSFTRSLTFLFPATNNNTEWYLVDGGTTVLLQDYTGARASMPVSVVSSTFWGLSLRRKGIGVGRSDTVTVNVSSKRDSYLISVAASKTGSASKTGAASLPTTSTAEALIGRVLFDAEGCKDDGSGTYTGVASALIEKSADVMHHLARVPGAVPLARIDVTSFQTARTDAPASYKFAGVVTDRSTTLRELLLALGAQCRTRPEWPADKLQARFIKSSYAAVSAKAITRDAINRASLSCRLGPEEDLINAVAIRYGRDWTKSRAEDAFAVITPEATDATSISLYGTRRKAERFWYDFIKADNSTMANDMRDFRVAELKNPARYIDIVGFLDQFEMLPGDLFAPNYLDDNDNVFDGLDGTVKFIVEEAGFAPGILSREQGPKMRFVLREVA